jgi:hypothetical protein
LELRGVGFRPKGRRKQLHDALTFYFSIKTLIKVVSRVLEAEVTKLSARLSLWPSQPKLIYSAYIYEANHASALRVSLCLRELTRVMMGARSADVMERREERRNVFAHNKQALAIVIETPMSRNEAYATAELLFSLLHLRTNAIYIQNAVETRRFRG